MARTECLCNHTLPAIWPGLALLCFPPSLSPGCWCCVCVWMQRAELANEQYLALTSVLEGFVILKPNPDWKPEGEKISPTKKKVR